MLHAFLFSLPAFYRIGNLWLWEIKQLAPSYSGSREETWNKVWYSKVYYVIKIPHIRSYQTKKVSESPGMLFLKNQFQGLAQITQSCSPEKVNDCTLSTSNIILIILCIPPNQCQYLWQKYLWLHSIFSWTFCHCWPIWIWKRACLQVPNCIYIWKCDFGSWLALSTITFFVQ